jgi:methylenetetrahydrofolate dehydrogenase (NADP+)/methenyltetrahydrofolate cyclohydrolase
MVARIIDGKIHAGQLRARIAASASALKAAHGIVPGLAVVLIGDDPASAIYVGAKGKAAREVGFQTFDIRLPDTISEAALLAEIAHLNGDAAVSGILVQMPLPAHIEAKTILAALDPLKDVDGFHPINVGRLSNGEYDIHHGLVPCTPLGCVLLLKDALGDMSGARALVMGRSEIVGKPMAQLLIQENCTVTVAHSRTRDVASIARQVDILVAAIGRPEIVKGDWIKEGATVIDVGTNRVEVPGGKPKLVGDVDFAQALSRAGAITPVPGGVGPMTIACLMRNTLMAAHLQSGLPAPEV